MRSSSKLIYAAYIVPGMIYYLLPTSLRMDADTNAPGRGEGVEKSLRNCFFVLLTEVMELKTNVKC